MKLDDAKKKGEKVGWKERAKKRKNKTGIWYVLPWTIFIASGDTLISKSALQCAFIPKVPLQALLHILPGHS